MSVEQSVQVGLGPDVSARSEPASGSDTGKSRPVRVDTDGTDRLVTVDLSDTAATPETLSVAISGDTLRVSDDSNLLLKVTVDNDAWRIADTTFNNGIYGIRLVQ